MQPITTCLLSMTNLANRKWYLASLPVCLGVSVAEQSTGWRGNVKDHINEETICSSWRIFQKRWIWRDVLQVSVRWTSSCSLMLAVLQVFDLTDAVKVNANDTIGTLRLILIKYLVCIFRVSYLQHQVWEQHWWQYFWLLADVPWDGCSDK